MKRILISVALLMMSSALVARMQNKAVKAQPCEFALSNDSKYPHIYVSTNRNLATVVNKRTLRESANVAEVSNVKMGKPAKIKGNSFYIYTPTDVAGQYVQNYCVSAHMTDQESKKFRFRFTQIAQNQVGDSRISVENMVGRAGVEPKQLRARTQMAAPAKSNRSDQRMARETREEKLKNDRVPENRGLVEKDQPSQPDYETYVDREYPLGILP